MQTESLLFPGPSTHVEFERTIASLLNEAREADKSDRRGEARHPYFRPLSLCPASDPERCFSAFSREISRTGIGLLHNMPLEQGEVMLSAFRDGGSTLKIRIEIVWCRACGEGWYLSGGRFMDPPVMR